MPTGRQANEGLPLFAVTPYEDKIARELIHYFKYKSFLAARNPLQELIFKYLNLFKIKLEKTVAVPIPLHKKRFRERGFNQSEILAEIVGEYFNLPIETELLTKNKKTKDQIKMKDYDERRKNIKGGFVLNIERLKYLKAAGIEKIILVDDVYTSGATIEEAAKLFRRAGFKNINIFVFAKAGYG